MRVKNIAWILLLVLIIWATHRFNLAVHIQEFQFYANQFGLAGPAAFISLMALTILIIPIPSSPLTLSAGALYGLWLGTLYSLIGAQIGAIIAFLIARGIGRDWLYSMFKKDLVFCRPCTVRHMTWLVFLLRLIPFTQFDIISYGAGLTAIPLRNYVIATLAGMIPAIFLEVLIGASFAFETMGLILTSVIMIAIVFAPIIIKRKNLFGLKKYIIHPPHLEKH